ncbi:hypothetical protein ACM66B_002914 [Microbotryomycetes sp. NB124-2]
MSSLKLRLNMGGSGGSSNGTLSATPASPTAAAAASATTMASALATNAPMAAAPAPTTSDPAAWPSTATVVPSTAANSAAASLSSSAPALAAASNDDGHAQTLARHSQTPAATAPRARSTSNAPASTSENQTRAKELAQAASATLAATLNPKLDKEARGVSSHKYRTLKRNYSEMAEARTRADYALQSAQKLVHQLRTDKQALLDRVLQLEVAAGITSTHVAQAHAQLESTVHRSELDPPPLPKASSAVKSTDRRKQLDVRTMATHLAVQQLAKDETARKKARLAPASRYPTLAALGLVQPRSRGPRTLNVAPDQGTHEHAGSDAHAQTPSNAEAAETHTNGDSATTSANHAPASSRPTYSPYVFAPPAPAPSHP